MLHEMSTDVTIIVSLYCAVYVVRNRVLLLRWELFILKSDIKVICIIFCNAISVDFNVATVIY